MKFYFCKTCGKKNKHTPRKTQYCNNACYQKNKSGSNNPKWKGGKIIIDGYFYIYSPNHPFKTEMGYVAEHRLVMEKHLDRYLNAKEIIHHLNHNKLDNKIENLHLCPTLSEHSLIHSKKRKRDSLGRYNS